MQHKDHPTKSLTNKCTSPRGRHLIAGWSNTLEYKLRCLMALARRIYKESSRNKAVAGNAALIVAIRAQPLPKIKLDLTILHVTSFVGQFWYYRRIACIKVFHGQPSRSHVRKSRTFGSSRKVGCGYSSIKKKRIDFEIFEYLLS